MSSALWFVAGLGIGFVVGWLARVAVATSERRMRLLTKRFWRVAHRTRDAERRHAPRIVQLLSMGTWTHTVGRN